MKVVLRKIENTKPPVHGSKPPLLAISYDTSFSGVGGDIPVFVGKHLIGKIYHSAYGLCLDVGANLAPVLGSGIFPNTDSAMTVIVRELLHEGGYLDIRPDDLGRPNFVKFSIGNILIGSAGPDEKGSIRFYGQFGSTNNSPEFSDVSQACNWLKKRLYAQHATTDSLLNHNPYYFANYTGVKPDRLSLVEYVIESDGGDSKAGQKDNLNTPLMASCIL